jgi:hypothetical protein
MRAFHHPLLTESPDLGRLRSAVASCRFCRLRVSGFPFRVFEYMLSAGNWEQETLNSELKSGSKLRHSEGALWAPLQRMHLKHWYLLRTWAGARAGFRPRLRPLLLRDRELEEWGGRPR